MFSKNSVSCLLKNDFCLNLFRLNRCSSFTSSCADTDAKTDQNSARPSSEHRSAEPILPTTKWYRIRSTCSGSSRSSRWTSTPTWRSSSPTSSSCSTTRSRTTRKELRKTKMRPKWANSSTRLLVSNLYF